MQNRANLSRGGYSISLTSLRLTATLGATRPFRGLRYGLSEGGFAYLDKVPGAGPGTALSRFAGRLSSGGGHVDPLDVEVQPRPIATRLTHALPPCG